MDDLISRQAAIDAVESMLRRKFGIGGDLAEITLAELPSAQPERTCVNCGRTVNNGGWYADGGTRCPIEEHYEMLYGICDSERSRRINMATTIGEHRPVEIKRNTNGDTRVAKRMPTISEFNDSNMSHREDVKNIVDRFCEILKCSSMDHDWTKVFEPYRSMFYRDMASVIEHGMDFFDGEWSKLHYYELERHHLKRHCPEDVDLFDVIEMICDCVAAGMARSGEVYDLDISDDILTKAVRNTVEILKDQIQVIE